MLCGSCDVPHSRWNNHLPYHEVQRIPNFKDGLSGGLKPHRNQNISGDSIVINNKIDTSPPQVSNDVEDADENDELVNSISFINTNTMEMTDRNNNDTGSSCRSTANQLRSPSAFHSRSNCDDHSCRKKAKVEACKEK